MFYHFSKYLKNIGFSIDLFTLKNFESKWESGYPFDKKIVDNLFFYDFAQKPGVDFIRVIIEKIHKAINRRAANQERNVLKNLPDFATPKMKLQLLNILKENEYSHIIVGYAYWANLLKGVDVGKIKKIISINDWLTVQMKDYYHNKVDVNNLLVEEINRVNMFDIAIEISTFEYSLFSQLAINPKHYLVPIFLNSTRIVKSKKPKYDIVFIAHKNIYNIEGVEWFVKNVLPLLPKIRLLIVGSVNKEIGELKSKNITQIEHVDDLSDVYKNTKLAICPLFGGTGLKVKVIEALSFGVPIICTTKSVAGFPYDVENGMAIEDDPIQFANKILSFTSNESLLKKMSTNAKKYFDKYFSEASVDAKLREIFYE